MKHTIYKITVKNWDKYNKTLKRGHKKIMISTGFLSDAKIRSLTPVSKLLYLSCLLVAGESTSPEIEVSHDSLVFQSGVKSSSLQSKLDELQYLQLVKYEKMPSNRIEKKGKEEKIRETKGNEIQPKSKSQNNAPVGTNEVIAFYCDEWKARYNASAPIGGRAAGQIKTFVKDHGVEKCKKFIAAYFKMPDSWFVTKRHDIPTMLTNLNSIAQFMETGRMFSKRELGHLDQAVAQNNLLTQIREEGI